MLWLVSRDFIIYKNMKRQRAYGQSYKYTGTSRRKRPRRNSYRRASVARTRGALVNTERKYFDVSYDYANLPIISNTGWTAATRLSGNTTLCCPQQGTSIANRVGNKIWLHKISFRGQVDQNSITGLVPVAAGTVRIVILQDKQTNGALYSASDVLGSGPSGQSIDSFQNTDSFGRFKVLKDYTFNLAQPAVAWDGTNLQHNGDAKSLRFTIKFKKPILVKFNNGNGGDVGDIIDNSFHIMCAQSNDANVSTSIHWKTRAYFTDP